MKNSPQNELSRFYTLWRESNSLYEAWAGARGLSLNSLLIIYSFYEECDGGICTQTSISRKWSIPKQTVNAILKDFESKGYIELVPNDTDKRSKAIKLTANGASFTDSIISELRTAELSVIEQMGIENMAEMNQQLEMFINLFNERGF